MMLIVILLAVSALANAGLLPAPGPGSSPTAPGLNSKCTFTLWHRRQSSNDYIQLNTIVDHANRLTIDVASRRPATAFNSYVQLERERAFAVAGLLDDARLTVAYGEDGALKFQVGEVKWSTGEVIGERVEAEGSGEAWCNAGRWKGSADRRVGCVLLMDGLAAKR